MDLRQWAKKKGPDLGEERKTSLDMGHTPGTAKHPFKVEDRAKYLEGIKGARVAARTRDAKVVKVPMSALRGTQGTVNREKLDAHIKDPNHIKDGTLSSGSGALIDRPIVVKKNGVHYIHDGHHRATAAHLRGQQHLECRLIDLDADAPVDTPMGGPDPAEGGSDEGANAGMMRG